MRVGEEKLSELSLGQPADVVGVVWRKVNPLRITQLVLNLLINLLIQNNDPSFQLENWEFWIIKMKYSIIEYLYLWVR
jgi:hypothetical protein